MTGTITRINGRGFGFLRRDETNTEVYFHCSALRNVRHEELWVGHRVEFRLGTGDRDTRPRALDVNLLEDQEAAS